jgi:long-subunit fatty acid transport protein
LAPAFLLLASLGPGTAGAAGFWQLDKGASNYGRGGANVAAPDDPIAMHTNPAALAGLPGLQLMIDADMIWDRRAFTRAPDHFDTDGDGVADREVTYDRVANSFAPLPPTPGVFATYNLATLGLRQLTLGAAVYGPPLAHTEWPADGPQRYSQIENHPLEIRYSLGAGYELPWLGLRVGATGALVSQIFDNALALNTFLSFPEEEGYDASVDVHTSDHLIPVGLFGMSVRPFSRLVLGVSFRTPYDAEGTGEAKLTLGRQLGRVAAVEGRALRAFIKMPAQVRAGVKYEHPNRRFDVEAAAVWELWSRNRDIIFRPEGIRVTPKPGYEALFDPVAIDDIVIESRYRDTYSLRGGGQYRLIDELLLLRGGAYFERASVGGGRLNAGTMDLDKLGVVVGGRVELPWHLWVDFALGYVHFFDKTVAESKTLLKNPLTVPPSDNWPIGNGLYEGYQLNAMLAVGVAVDI